MTTRTNTGPTVYVYPAQVTMSELVSLAREYGLRLNDEDVADLLDEANTLIGADGVWRFKLALDMELDRNVGGVAVCVSHHSFRTTIRLEPR